MLTITAVIRAKKGHEGAMRDALLDVAANVQANESDTIAFFISQDVRDACVFTNYERFVDQMAMERHNGSPVVAKFFAIANPIPRRARDIGHELGDIGKGPKAHPATM